MSNNGAALLGGLLIGGLVVGAAMSADNAAERQHQRNMRAYRQQERQLHHTTYCICGAQMTQGRIQQGIAKCNNLNCQRVLTGSICYYCPNGGNVQQHRQGFFYCEQCALAVRRSGNKVIQQQQVPVPQPQPQPQTMYPAQQQPPKGQNYIVKQGYMSKKGEWFNTAYKKRWFKLWSNKKMAYLTHPGASYTKGYADLTAITKMEKKGKHGLEVHTKARVWSFLCQSEQDRDSWFATIQSVCMGIQPQVYAPQPMPQPPVQYVQAPPMQPQPQYVAQPQPQPQYVNGNVPQQAMYAQPMQPQPQPQPQPMYRGSVNQAHLEEKNNQELQPHDTRGKSQSLQPGMLGYNAGDMYKSGNNNDNGNVQQQKWEDDAPPAYSDATAPPEDDLMPSAPPLEEENEGAYTGQ